MKKVLLTAAAVGITAAMLMPMASFADFGRTYTAPKGTPTIDGEADLVWDFAEWTDVDKPHNGDDKADYDETLKIKLLWDENNLYFYAQVHDLDINYDNDIIEIYLDENNCKEGAYQDDDSQTRFKSDGADATIEGATPNPKLDAKVASKQLDDGFILEGALPWYVAQKEGNTLGLEFMYNDGGADADFIIAFRWNVDTANGDPAPYADTSAFGTLILGSAPVIATEAPETEAPAPETEAPAPAETAAPAAPVAETAAPVAEAAPAAPAPAAQTADFTALAVVTAVAAIGSAVIIKHR